MSEATQQFRTFVDLVHEHAVEQPDRAAFSFLSHGVAEPLNLTLGELDTRARSIAAHLMERGLGGERVLLLYPPGLEYIAAYFGCLYAGAVAVPMYPIPEGRTSARHLAVIKDSAPAAAIADGSLTERLEHYRPAGVSWEIIDARALEGEGEAQWQRPEIDRETVAFLQYTSGSTSTPKGVMVSHRNLLENSSEIQASFQTSPETNAVSWLPPYHDMGLIGGILQPLYAGYHSVLMSPVSFVMRPLMWLQAVSQARARISGGPNFAYDLCAERISDEEVEKLDLSSWSLAFNGAEPVRPATLQRFARKFAAAGFRASAFFPCYGLAEATLFVAGRHCEEERPFERFRDDSLAPGQRVQDAGDEGTPLVSCGAPPSGVQVTVADPETGSPCEPGRIGEIFVSGASVAAGYWKRAPETEETFCARLPGSDGHSLRTGDLGFLHGGELYITGRKKDLLIIRGRNHYPNDIEYTVERSHPMLRANAGAAIEWEADGRRELVIVHEVQRSVRADKFDSIVTAIRGALAREHGLLAHAIALVRASKVPKTSSGKIQRFRCKEMLADETLEVLHYAELGAGRAVRVELAGVDEALWPSTVRARLRELLEGRLQGALDDSTPLVALGMDSLTALEIRADVSSAFGVELAIDDLLGGIALDDLIEVIVSQSGESDAAEAPARSEASPEGDRDPLSIGQQALWFLEQQFPDTSAQHIYAAIRFLSPVDEGALGRVIQKLVDRHPVLRTALRAEAGEPYQVVLSHQDAAFVIEDAAGWSEAELEARLEEEATGQRFSLTEGNMLRAVLFRRRDTSVLSLVIHHIAADMWSLALLTEELGLLYEREMGREVALRPASAPRAYCDLARKQRAMLEDARGEELWSYWSKQLEGCKAVLDLPSDRPRPPQQSYSGDTTTFEIGPEVTRALRELAVREDTTLFVVLLSVFQGLIHRYTGEEDFLVGIATSGRTSAESQGLVGYFVNPVLIRARLDGNTRFDDHLRATKGTVLDGLAHQEFPFPVLVERLRLQRDASRPPGYQVLFSLTTPHLLKEEGMGAFQMGRRGARMKIGSLEVESMDLVRRTAQVDMSFVLSEVGDGLAGMINFSTDLFDQVTIDRFAAHFTMLASRLASQPATPVGMGELLTDDERRRIEAYNATRAEYPHDRTVGELFQEQAARHPDSPALTFGDTTLSYRELSRVANALARRLQELGAGPEQTVALYLDREAAAIISLLATAMAGAAYVPLDPSHPTQRLRNIVTECASRVVVARGEVPPELLPEGVTALDVSPFLDPSLAQDAANDEPAPCRATADSLLYVMFTSGSSGAPKGIGIRHGSVVAYVRNKYLHLEVGERFAQASNAAFDASTFEIWGAFLNGAHLVGFERSIVVSPPLLAKALREREVSTLYLNSALLNRVTECAPDTFKDVKQMFFGGEFADAKRVRTLLEVGGPRLNHIYGTTENTGFSTWHPVTEVPPGATRLSIGHPIANSYLYVLDENLQHQPFGVAGEIYIGGAGVARGYINQHGLTAARFLPDPFCDLPGARMYASGDLGRRLQDGTIEVLGRADFQVKIRGFRVELEEIESAVLEHSGVVECVAVLDVSRPEDKRLVCYFVGAVTPDELRQFLGARLPEYMVPTILMRLSALPKNPNGKVSRGDLPAPVEHGEAAEAAPEQGDSVEAALAAVFADLLGVPQVGFDDNFFELGGHSLLATRLIVYVSNEYGVDLPLNELFNNPTVRTMANHIKSAQEGPGSAGAGSRGPTRVAREKYKRGRRSPRAGGSTKS